MPKDTRSTKVRKVARREYPNALFLTPTSFLGAPFPKALPRAAGKKTRKSAPPVQRTSDLPAELAAPARRALIGAGYVGLGQLTSLTEAEVLQLHGVGPKALGTLRSALGARGLSFSGDEP